MNLELNKMNNVFQIPLLHSTNVKKLEETTMNDLELTTTIKEEEENKPIYEYVFQPKSIVARKVLTQIAESYTTDTQFLKDNQQLLKNMKINDLNEICQTNGYSHEKLNDTLKMVDEIKNDTGFCTKYLYVDWDFAKFMNHNTSFLHFMSIYNVASPLLSLCLPIFVLIIPFLIIKMKGIELTTKEYVDVLKTIISKHALTRIFTDFHKVDFGQKMYLLVSVAFYLFSIYQNILVCVRFYSNMKKIHDYLFSLKTYLQFTQDSMKYHLSKSDDLHGFKNFNESIVKKMNKMDELKEQIDCITPFHLSYKKVSQIGHIMKIFYELHENDDYHEILLFSFGFNGYMENLIGVKSHYDSGKMNTTNFSLKKKQKPIFKNMYYAKFVGENDFVKNNCDMKKNMIITGPNASGKTTTLKTSLLNVLLSQQMGVGCFDECTMHPYDNIHCYLNIPDTSGRDSLFQAEARRCKEIIESVSTRKEETHFCIFDELYSGTNPEEAVISAKAFMEYLVKHENVSCMLTTHYIKLCKKLSKNKKIINCHMETIVQKDDENFKSTYLIKKGISSVKGGIKILKDMNYPKEILQGAGLPEPLD